MAINKRKDAAALFELIDKSTLKVPKSAGSLKIPKWWSSKSNPPSTTAMPGKGRTAAPAARSTPQTRATLAASPGTTTSAMAAPAVETAIPQKRLFEPPPPNVPPAASPSIRPPVAQVSAPASPAVKPAATPAVSVPVHEAAPSEQNTKPSAAAEPRGTGMEGDASSEARVFAPMTHAPGSRPWPMPRSGYLARMPASAVVLAAGVVLVVVLGIVWLARGSKPSSSAPGTVSGRATPGSAGGVTAQRSLLPPTMGNGGGGSPSVTNRGNPLAPTDQTPGASHIGRVYPPGELRFSPDLNYVIIASTPLESIARRNADFIAGHGVDVAIETVKRNGKLWYTVVSAVGYPTVALAKPLCDRIVAIGHELPEYKKSGAWDDAYIRPIVSSSAPLRSR